MARAWDVHEEASTQCDDCFGVVTAVDPVVGQVAAAGVIAVGVSSAV